MPRVVQSNSLHFGLAGPPPAESNAVRGKDAGLKASSDLPVAGRMTLTDHYRSDHCLVCGHKTEQGVCIDCRQSPRDALSMLLTDVSRSTCRLISIMRVCASCASTTGQCSSSSASPDTSAHPQSSSSRYNFHNHNIPPPPPCLSVDCPVLYERVGAKRNLDRAAKIQQYVEVVLEQ
ncbi:DNA POLYMERASE [Ceraceosorus bombacis]|uniref:DNA POLYMERASE n=1 Tax=Ceraceosorus bombacis TaxID=401625 RepID=A0A0N7LAM7_9BASI|nr:DNA POLYMERASE [Ceraceosorus bombacis]